MLLGSVVILNTSGSKGLGELKAKSVVTRGLVGYFVEVNKCFADQNGVVALQQNRDMLQRKDASQWSPITAVDRPPTACKNLSLKSGRRHEFRTPAAENCYFLIQDKVPGSSKIKNSNWSGLTISPADPQLS